MKNSGDMDATTSTILEQYKVYVEMADRVSERRLKTNQFYISIISGLLAVLTFIFGQESFSNLKQYESHTVIAIGVLGILLNLVWLVNIQSFRQLNTGKFKVIHEMEARLPFPPYDREWQIIQHGLKEDRYRQLTIVEQYLPVLLAIPFILLLTTTLI